MSKFKRFRIFHSLSCLHLPLLCSFTAGIALTMRSRKSCYFISFGVSCLAANGSFVDSIKSLANILTAKASRFFIICLTR